MRRPFGKAELILSAVNGGAEVSLLEVIGWICSPSAHDLVLDQVNTVRLFLDEFEFIISPGLETGSLETMRIIRPKTELSLSEETVAEEIRRGEGAQLEFKSSLIYHYKKAKALPNAPLSELRSDDVLHEALKTLAAFLNCGGGVLMVGIDNSSTPLGLAPDCALLGLDHFDADRWELELRSQVTGGFKNGASINDYVTVRFFCLEQREFARIAVQGRRHLAFLLKNRVKKLYRRQGNRSIEVEIDDLEEFVEYRKSQGWQ